MNRTEAIHYYEDNCTPEPRPHRTLPETIRYANEQGWRWFTYGILEYRVDDKGQWKGRVITKIVD